MKKIWRTLQMKQDYFWATLMVLIGAVLHGYNMWHFPFFENDEGTYLAQAWSFLSEGKLAPYTYWYDHAPFGWIFTSVWIAVTGGLFTFGFALNSARVFMWLIHILNCILLYSLSKKITRSSFASMVTLFFFSVSPLAVYFQRRLLLDNLMTFWMLVTFFLVFTSRNRLRRFFLSAVTFGFAVLTKENAVFFFPVLVWLVAHKAHDNHRAIAFVKWVVIVGAVISLYPLYALLKGELFPAGVFFSPSYPHVSLLGTLAQQSARGSGLPFWEKFSDFQINLAYWYKEDHLLIAAGFISFLIHGVLSLKNYRSRLVFLLTLPQVLFLCSGKLVINFYIVPLIPFLSLSIGLLTAYPYLMLRKLRPRLALTFAVIVFSLLIWQYAPLVKGYLFKDETTAQLEAVDWIKKEIPPDKSIAIDFYSYLDLSQSRFPGDPVFPNADWFWKVELDPDITEKKLHSDFRNLDYVMITAEAQRQIPNFPGQTSLLRNALLRSQKVAIFSDNPKFEEFFTLQKQTMPNGDWVVMYQQQRLDLKQAWENYKINFYHSEGYIQGPEQKGYVISEAQSYALLRAVWMDDKPTFDATYAWTKKHMQLKDSHLFGWKWLERGNRLVDQGNAPDADQDIALALMFATARWGDTFYREEAAKIVSDIWKYNVYQDNRYTLVTAGNWANSQDYVTLNPSYWSPYAYRLFAELDPSHPWQQVVDSSYLALENCSSSLLDKNYRVFLPPEWCRYEKAQGSFVQSGAPQPNDSNYGFNAFRVPWKIYLDYQWNQEPRAETYLKKMDFLLWKHDSEGLRDVYSHDGVAQTKSQRYAYLMNLPVFLLTDEKVAQEIIRDQIMPAFHYQDGEAYWYEGDEYYLQNWAWFGAGIYQGELVNLAKDLSSN